MAYLINKKRFGRDARRETEKEDRYAEKSRAKQLDDERHRESVFDGARRDSRANCQRNLQRDGRTKAQTRVEYQFSIFMFKIFFLVSYDIVYLDTKRPTF